MTVDVQALARRLAAAHRLHARPTRADEMPPALTLLTAFAVPGVVIQWFGTLPSPPRPAPSESEREDSGESER